MKEKKNDYLQVLEFAANYGHGVFTSSFIPDRNKQEALRFFVKRHPEYVMKFQGVKRKATLYVLTNKGKSFVGGLGPITRSKTSESLKDLVTINLHLYRMGLKISYQNTPNVKIKTPNGIFGILSYKWGIPRNFEELDYLVTPRNLKSIFQSKIGYLHALCHRHHLNQKRLVHLISEAVTVNTI